MHFLLHPEQHAAVHKASCYRDTEDLTTHFMPAWPQLLVTIHAFLKEQTRVTEWSFLLFGDLKTTCIYCSLRRYLQRKATKLVVYENKKFLDTISKARKTTC